MITDRAVTSPAGRRGDLLGEPAGIEAGERGHHIGDGARRAQAAQRVSRMTCFSALAGWAWDLRLYLVCPQPDLMGTDTGRRSFPGAVVHRLPDINLNNEDRVQARQRMGQYMDASGPDGTRITQDLGFEVARSAAA